MGDETQCGLLTLLETSQQQQQVTFLVHQSFPEALSTQVTLIQTLHLQTEVVIVSSLCYISVTVAVILQLSSEIQHL